MPPGAMWAGASKTITAMADMNAPSDSRNSCHSNVIMLFRRGRWDKCGVLLGYMSIDRTHAVDLWDSGLKLAV
jgi:hypothetical protein